MLPSRQCGPKASDCVRSTSLHKTRSLVECPEQPLGKPGYPWSRQRSGDYRDGYNSQCLIIILAIIYFYDYKGACIYYSSSTMTKAVSPFFPKRNLIQTCLLGAVACLNSQRQAAEPVPISVPTQKVKPMITIHTSTRVRSFLCSARRIGIFIWLMLPAVVPAQFTVNLATGNSSYNHVDLRIPSPGLSFEFKRFYNAKDTTSAGPPLGFGWTHSYNIRLSVTSSNSAVVIAFGDGHQESYSTNGAGGFTSEAGVFNSLTTSSGTFTLTTKAQQKYIFDAQGQLTSIVDKNANSVTLIYNGSNLITITDPVGRSINFSYNANGCLTQITDPLGRTVQFVYGSSTNLISVTDPRGGVTQFAYNANHQIIQAIDPLGNTFVSLVYNGTGVVSSQTDALGDATTFGYNFVNGVTTVTDAKGDVSYNH